MEIMQEISNVFVGVLNQEPTKVNLMGRGMGGDARSILNFIHVLLDLDI